MMLATRLKHGLSLGLGRKFKRRHSLLPPVDISPYLPPSNSCNAAAALGSRFLGAGNSICSLSMRMNIERSRPGELFVLRHERHGKDLVPALTDIMWQGPWAR